MMPIALGPIQNFVLLQLLIMWLRKLGLLPPDPAPDEGDFASINDVRIRALAYVNSLPLNTEQKNLRLGEVNQFCNQWQANGCNLTWTPTT